MASRNKEQDELAASFGKVLGASKDLPPLSRDKAIKLLSEIDSLPDDSVKSTICSNRFGLTLFEVQNIAQGVDENSISNIPTHKPLNGVTDTPPNGNTTIQATNSTVTHDTYPSDKHHAGIPVAQQTALTHTQLSGVTPKSSHDTTAEQTHISFNMIGTLLRSDNQIKVFVFLYDRLTSIPPEMTLTISATEVASALDLSLHTARKIIPNILDKNLIKVTPLTRQEKKVKQGYKMNVTPLGIRLYSELKRDINCDSIATPPIGVTVTPPNGATIKKATVTPLHPLTTTSSDGIPISSGGFLNNIQQQDATPSLPLDDLIDRLDLTEWEKLDPGMLVGYIQKGREWIQDILDGTAAAIEFKKNLAAEKPEMQNSVIKMPFRFLKSNLANGYVDTPPGWKTRQQKAMEAEIARLKKDNELALQLQKARKQREEGRLMLQFEEMLADPSGDLFQKVKALIPAKEIKSMTNLHIAEGHPAFNKHMEKYFKVYLGMEEE